MIWFLVMVAVGVAIAVAVYVSGARRPRGGPDRLLPPVPGPAGGTERSTAESVRPRDTRPARSVGPNPKGRFFGRTAMVVEDSSTVQHMVGMLLAPEGFELVSADGYRSARLALVDQRPDLMIVDRDLWAVGGGPNQPWPDLGGTPLILLTGRQAGPGEVAVPAAAAVVAKPFGSQELIDAVEQALASGTGRPVCPVCGYPVEGEPTRCEICSSAHHAECWTLNDGCGQCGRSG